MLPKEAMKSHYAVELRVRVAGPFKKTPHVAVAGEISAWDMPIPVPVELDAEGAAHGTLALSLPPGMYAYKLLVNGGGARDAEGVRTGSGGQRAI